MGNKTSSKRSNNSIFQKHEILIDVLVHGFMRIMNTGEKIQMGVISTIIDYARFEYHIYKFSKGASNIHYDEQFSQLFQNNSTFSLPSDIYFGSHSKYYIINRKNNKLYGKGININSCLGIDNSTNEVKTFTELIFDENNKLTDKIKFLSNGMGSSRIMMTKTKTFYGWGNNKDYQLGYDQSKIIKTPIKLATLTNTFYKMTIIKIECGMKHTLFLTNDGKIFAIGSNKFGCCGQQKQFKMTRNPIHINTSTDNNGLGFVTDIAVGSTFNLLLDKNKTLWCFGSNVKNELGFDGGYDHKPVEYIPIINPELNEMDFDVVKCGTNHSLCIEEKTKKCFVFGSNYSGQITNDKQTKVYKTMYKNIVNGWCGEDYTVLLNKQLKIRVFGDLQATNDMLLNFGNKTKNDVIVRVIAACSDVLLVVKR